MYVRLFVCLAVNMYVKFSPFIFMYIYQKSFGSVCYIIVKDLYIYLYMTKIVYLCYVDVKDFKRFSRT